MICLDADLKRAVERELYNLPRYKARLKNLNLDLIDHPRPDVVSGGGKGNLPGDPTGSIASRELDIKAKIVSLEAKIKRIENALEALSESERKLIDLRYLSPQRYDNDYVKDVLAMSKSTYYQFREDVLETIAEIIGLSAGN